MAKQPTLHVPFIDNLEEYNIAEIGTILEEKGARQMIQSINWSNEFPYQPLSAFASLFGQPFP